MTRYVEELHNKEDAGTFWDTLLFFLGMSAILFVLGVIFWAAV